MKLYAASRRRHGAGVKSSAAWRKYRLAAKAASAAKISGGEKRLKMAAWQKLAESAYGVKTSDKMSGAAA
jgi:hypothetical protein